MTLNVNALEGACIEGERMNNRNNQYLPDGLSLAQAKAYRADAVRGRMALDAQLVEAKAYRGTWPPGHKDALARMRAEATRLCVAIQEANARIEELTAGSREARQSVYIGQLQGALREAGANPRELAEARAETARLLIEVRRIAQDRSAAERQVLVLRKQVDTLKAELKLKTRSW